MEQNVPRLAWSAQELAQAVGCTEQHIRDLIREGVLDSFTLGRSRRIPHASVMALIASAKAES
jgi:excisionase family DNA binding protein